MTRPIQKIPRKINLNSKNDKSFATLNIVKNCEDALKQLYKIVSKKKGIHEI